jgi:hypothetical protein
LESIPRAVYQHLWPNEAAPSNPTQLAKLLGVKQNTLQGWYTKMPADRRKQVGERYGFTPLLRWSFQTDTCQKFKDLYELYWKTRLSKLPITTLASGSSNPTTIASIATS